MEFVGFITRGQTQTSPTEFGPVLTLLSNVGIMFEQQMFEHRNPQDFIFYKFLHNNTEVTFAMKVLCTDNYFKITKIYYKYQIDLITCFYVFRKTIVEDRSTELDSGINMILLWEPEICNNTIKNFAMISNIMEENNFEFQITKTNKNNYYGKDIVFDNTPATQGIFSSAGKSPATQGTFSSAAKSPAAQGIFPSAAKSPATQGIFPSAAKSPATQGIFSSAAKSPATQGIFSSAAKSPAAQGTFPSATTQNGFLSSVKTSAFPSATTHNGFSSATAHNGFSSATQGKNTNQFSSIFKNKLF